ncbi:MAG: winged helix-turn-helix domain-containing protein [Candidatus Methanoperedens sp.]|nr:winged helix-turn-helix domain-containing protein [Candidatus Methanoperedens sp.]
MSKNKLTDIDYNILTALLKAERELCYSEIKNNCGLTDPTLSSHLKKLSQKGSPLVRHQYLRRKSNKKKEYPHPVYYYFNNNIEILKKLIDVFIDTPQLFHLSAYCQSMINRKLVEKIKTDWNYRKDCELTDIKMPLGEYLKWYLSDKDLEWILKASPSALKTALTPPERKKHFVELMLLDLIIDVRKNNLPVNLSLDMKVGARDRKHRINKQVGEGIYRLPPDPPYKVGVDLR